MEWCFVTSSGFKPETFRAVIWCSIQLSYEADFECKDKNFFAIAMLLKKNTLKKLLFVVAIVGVLFILLMSVMRSSIETPDYEVLRVLNRKAEIRRYPDLILAQTQLDSNTYSENSSLGFRRVAGYIFGGNEQGQKIAMT